MPYTSVSEYFQQQLTIPAIDYLISEINYRFNKTLSDTICQIKILLPSNLAEHARILASADIPNLLTLYHDDLPAPTSLDTELHCCGVKWSDPEVLEEAKGIDNPQKTLSSTDGDFFQTSRG